MPVDLQQYGSLETILSLRIVTKLSQFREIPESWIEYLFAMMVTSTDVFVIQATQSELLHLTNRLDLKWHKIQEWMHITGVDQENTETDNLEPERNLEALLEVGTQMMDSETNINESGQMIFVSLVRFLSSLEAGSITASLCRFMSKIANHCTDDEWRSIHSECLEIQYPDLFECYRVIHHFQAHNERMDALRIEMAKRSLGIDDPLQYITLLKDQTLDYPTVLTQMRMYTAFMTKKVIENKVLGLTRETGTRVAKNTCLYSRQDR
ncbi:hypothetical protein EDD86DRAFT_121124 [Gorgonomyces haynaldii]|nr:hypothetical protein EDD86DRAFT_121124 [Gorgonomyces haynaldii]